ncbi:hypothetical protein C8N40_103190 [Pontibacter mucosus]|uniref:Dolichyl-phosphate-mannose-protein mannosyltransferase n=1 Tax=Pontibacter mucosus TaxID=1649266 RepID=A0A2T5YLD0_9BACT|nr:hypothetical protein [Pontibacter mucosus]PTX20115.1 hypothetical protein C8N40_103190 [Pontibacter mucosus]
MLPLGKKFSPFLFIVALLSATLLILSLRNFGIGLSNDSIAYWAAAESFYETGSFFLSYRDTYFTDWPPLFSIFLSSAYFLGIGDKLYFYGLLVVVVYVVVLYIFGVLAFQLTKSKLLTSVALILFVTAPPTYFTFSYLWTETFFILFTIIFLVGLERYLNNEKQSFLFLCASVAGLSVLLRYGGVINIATGCLFLFLYQNVGFYDRVKRTLRFGIISSIPLLFWLVRNYYLSSTLTGEGRTVAFAHFKYTLVMTAKAFWQWFMPYPEHAHAGILVILMVGILFIGIGYFIYFNFKYNRRNKLLLLILAVSCFLYFLLAFSTSLFQSSDFPDARLTSPAFFSFLLILISIASLLLSFKNKFAAYFFLSVLGVVCLYNANRYCYYYTKSLKVGVSGHTDIVSRNSAIIKSLQNADWLNEYTLTKTAFTNFPEKLYFNGVNGVLKITKGFRNDLSEQFLEKSSEKLVIWVGEEEELLHLIEMRLIDYNVTKAEQFPDGVILWLTLNQAAPLQEAEGPLQNKNLHLLKPLPPRSERRP